MVAAPAFHETMFPSVPTETIASLAESEIALNRASPARNAAAERKRSTTARRSRTN